MTKQVFRDLNGTENEYDGIEPIDWRISGYVVIHHKDSILCIKQSYSNKYELPGGGINVHESMIEGVKREFMEEVGSTVIVSLAEPFYIYESKFYNKDQEPKFFHSLALFFVGTLDTKLPAAIEGMPEAVWIPIGEVYLIQDMHQLAIKKILESRRTDVY